MNKAIISKFLKRFINFQNFGNFLPNFWEKYSRLVFFIFSLVILSLGINFWYQNIYKSEWSSDKKTQYKNSQNKEIDLNESQFKKVMGEIEKRSNLFGENVQNPKDIFAPYAGDQKEGSNPNINNSSPIESSNGIAPIIPR